MPIWFCSHFIKTVWQNIKLGWFKFIAQSKKTCLERVFVKFIVYNFISKEKRGNSKKKECKKSDQKIKSVMKVRMIYDSLILKY